MRSVRAAQLATPDTRRTIAAVQTVVESAEECRHDRCSCLVLEHDAVLEARDGLVVAAGRLRSDEKPPTPRALALAVVLAEHRDSPLVSAVAAHTVREALAEIAAAR